MGKKLPSEILRYLVIDIFREGPSYGYEVVSKIEDVTDGHWSPSYGTIYPLIQRLEEQGLLESLSEKEAEQRDLGEGDRKYFELTEKGLEEAVDVEKDGPREAFSDLILGYLRIYRKKYDEEALEALLDEV